MDNSQFLSFGYDVLYCSFVKNYHYRYCTIVFVCVDLAAVRTVEPKTTFVIQNIICKYYSKYARQRRERHTSGPSHFNTGMPVVAAAADCTADGHSCCLRDRRGLLVRNRSDGHQDLLVHCHSDDEENRAVLAHNQLVLRALCRGHAAGQAKRVEYLRERA